MNIPGLDDQACARRNLAAALQGRNAAPLKLYASVPPPTMPAGHRLVTAAGTLPKDDGEAVARINASLGLAGTADELPREKILLVYPEVANRNYIPKYQMFLGLSTLKNIASAGADGISLMNSHRTGGMSQPTELPYGRTFCARLETMADPAGGRDYRVVLGGYMIAGLRPNGANGPSTDDLHAMIAGGTLNEVSLGFKDAGEAYCDVCGRNLDDTDEDGDPLCNHCPGTHKGMDGDQIAAQEARGIPGGVATFTLEDAHVSEVSAVYAGALAGAGFRRAARMARKTQLSAAELREVRTAFAPLLSAAPETFGRVTVPEPQAPVSLSTKGNPVNHKELYDYWVALGRPQGLPLAELAAQFGMGLGQPSGPAADPPPVAAAAAAAPTPATAPNHGSRADSDDANSPVLRQLAALREEMDEQNRRFAAEKEQARRDACVLEADRWVDGMIRLGHASAAERASLVVTYTQAAADDVATPAQLAFKGADGHPRTGGRLDAFKSGVQSRPASQAGQQFVAGHPNFRPGVAPQAGDGQGTTLAAEEAPADPNQLDQIYQLAARYAKRRNGHTGGPNGLASAR